ncbi:MAG: hypothetical protein WCS37_15405 [Chloroflexota bacterium]
MLKYLWVAWGGATGFVVGTGLTALLIHWLGGWPASEAYLRRFLKEH